jgi:hypothetical protein
VTPTLWLLVVLLVLLVADLAVSIVALRRSYRTDAQLHEAIKHPVRLHGPVK